MELYLWSTSCIGLSGCTILSEEEYHSLQYVDLYVTCSVEEHPRLLVCTAAN